MAARSGLVRLLTVLTRAFLVLWIADVILLYHRYFDVPEYLRPTPVHPWSINLKGRELFVDEPGWWMDQLSTWGVFVFLGLCFVYSLAVDRAENPSVRNPT